ncbi:TPA: DNA repair protein RecN [Candidatus Poribacteria bacterium]|nr:DNA repair protein RecN [Candidatus Poribacteria bacterium]
MLSSMLQELDIRNYALIERVKIVFSEGLNILTGETGAGKSIIIGALGLVLGERSSPDVIRTGADSAYVRAIIDISKSPSVNDLLSETNLKDEDSDILILSREISKNGRNKYVVNDQSSTLQTIRQIGDNLVDIHGQHEHQTLFRPEKHIEILDDFGGLKDLVQQNTDIYNDLKKLLSERDFLIKDRDEKLRQKELFEFQLNELKSAKLEDGEEEKLLRERQLLNNAELIFELSNRIYQLLYDSDDPNIPSTIDLLKSMRSDFAKLCQIDNQVNELSSRFESSIYELEDIANQVLDYRDKIDFDPLRITEVETRLDLLYKLKRKYGVDSVAELIEYKNDVAKKLEDISLSSTKIDDIESEIKRKTELASKIASELSKKRQENAKKLKVLIEKELKTLGMEKTIFEVKVTQNSAQLKTGEDNSIDIDYNDNKVKLSPNGIDSVEFLISPNPGEDLRPLTKIASGGEISRIMLAIKTVLAVGTSHSSPIILIFDEIDTGISGRIAEIVGRKLKELSRSRQVICITHLPQIASLADNHCRVQKKVVGDRTFVEVENLDYEERVNEIARMLAGEKITEVTLAHAREMILNARR